MEGTADALLRRGPRRRDVEPARAKAGGLLLRPALRGLRDAIDPEAPGRRVPARPAPARRRPARLVRRARDRARDRARRARRARRRRRAHARAARRRGRAAARRRRRPRPPLRSPIHDPRRGPRAASARTWPTSSSSIPARVEEATRFKEDLEADSLDLYSLVQELEDTYGVRMSDEEAARITDRRPGGRLRARPTRRPSTASRGPDPCASCTTCSTGCRTTSPGRRSRTPRGPSSRADSYERLALPRRLRARPVGHDAPVPAARRRAYGAGRLTKIRAQAVSGRSCRAVAERLGLPERLRAAAPAEVAPAALGGARRDRARAGLGDRGGDRRLLPRLRLRADGRGGASRRSRRRSSRRSSARPTSSRRCRSGSRGAARRDLRGDRRGAARRTSASSRSRRWSTARRSRAARAARRRTPSRRRPPRRCDARGSRGADVHLRSITLKGFKSFPDRTRLEFSPGVSVIVGPERLGQVERHRRGAVGDGRAVAAGRARPVDAGRDLRRRARRAGARGGRGRGRARQLRRRGRPAAVARSRSCAGSTARARASTASTARAAG